MRARAALAPVTFALLLALALPAGAQSPPSEGERLLITPPQGWQATPSATQGTMVSSRMFPPGQTPETWTEAISVQRHNDRAAKAKDFVQGMVQTSRKSCEGVQVGNLEETPINGYPAASVRVACTKGKQTGQSGLMMVTAIRGREAMFVVQRMWKGPPVTPNQAVPVPTAVLIDFTSFAKTITVCDNRTPDHPCAK